MTLLTLLFSVFLSLLLLRLTQALVCHSTICTDPDVHGFCEQTCHENQACLGTFYITSNHTAMAGTFQCHNVSDQDCLASTCQIEQMTGPFGVCCCRTDYCNIVPGLFSDLSPAPPIILPTLVPLPPLLVKQLVCEFNNCTSSLVTNCFHGYEICAEHPMAEVSPHGPKYFCAVHAVKLHNGLYKLQLKGCVFTNNTSILNCGMGQSQCVLDTTSTNNQIECYCDHLYCNDHNGLNITEPGRFIGTDPDVLCDSLGCSHSCIIADNTPRCLCPAGYALDTDLQTCTGKFS